MDLPSQLSAGTPARLFSSLKLSNKELIATSSILAVFRLVPELLSDLIRDTGMRINDKTILNTFTEVNVTNPQGDKKDRPDGFIYIKKRNIWTALVEVKVGNSVLNIEQVTRYVEDARANDIDAVITISNEFTPRVDQSPIAIPKRLLKKVKLYHLSWRLVLSTAMLLKHQVNINDREKSFVIDEFIKFLRDDSVGNKSYTMMPPSWTDVAKEASMGAKLKSSDAKVMEVSNALVEEFSEIALILTDHLGVECLAKLPRAMHTDKHLWQNYITKTICENKPAICKYDIPDAANVLTVEIDLSRSSFAIGMEVNAPGDIVTVAGKINWLTRQLKNNDAKNSLVKIRRKSRDPDFVDMQIFTSKEFRQIPSTGVIISFTPMMQLHSSKVFNSRKNFIVELESMILKFYDTHGQHLKAWVPRAPKPLSAEEIEELEKKSIIIDTPNAEI